MDELYGFDGDEFLEVSPVAVYERWASDSDFPDCINFPTDGALYRVPASLEIVEWSTAPVGERLLSVDRILETIYDHFADDAEYEDASDDLERQLGKPEVIAAFTAARDLLASKMTFRYADRKLRVLTVTWDENNEPLLDGEPMYRSAP